MSANIRGTTRLAGVMGWPVTHSRSPCLHNYWLAEHRIDGAYVPLPVKPANLGAALRGVAALGFAGANLTVPHKQTAMSLVDRVDAVARRIGAMNLAIVAADGSLEGRNTDVYGFVENLRQQAPDWRANAPAVVLGAGGGARAVIIGLIDAGIAEVRVANRTRGNAEALRALGAQVRIRDWEARNAALDGAGLLVNTTMLGMAGEESLGIDLRHLPPEAVVCDIVYTPLETALLAAARARGHAIVDGLGMLLHQGRPSFRAFFGIDPAVTPELRAHVLRDVERACGSSG